MKRPVSLCIIKGGDMNIPVQILLRFSTLDLYGFLDQSRAWSPNTRGVDSWLDLKTFGLFGYLPGSLSLTVGIYMNFVAS